MNAFQRKVMKNGLLAGNNTATNIETKQILGNVFEYEGATYKENQGESKNLFTKDINMNDG